MGFAFAVGRAGHDMGHDVHVQLRENQQNSRSADWDEALQMKLPGLVHPVDHAIPNNFMRTRPLVSRLSVWRGRQDVTARIAVRPMKMAQSLPAYLCMFGTVRHVSEVSHADVSSTFFPTFLAASSGFCLLRPLCLIHVPCSRGHPSHSCVDVMDF